MIISLCYCDCFTSGILILSAEREGAIDKNSKVAGT